MSSMLIMHVGSLQGLALRLSVVESKRAENYDPPVGTRAKTGNTGAGS